MLSTSVEFAKDVEGKQTSVYPLLIINPDDIFNNPDNAIAISTIKETIKAASLPAALPIQFNDYNLKISNIKESIDIENRKFKISNLTLTLSNYEINGVRISDSISQLTNSEVVVYFKTPSCTSLDKCLIVYKGLLKEAKFDNKTIKITLEDDTQSKFHKDVPIANLKNSEYVYNKDYVNRYIPILYGAVDKAPAIPCREGNADVQESNIIIITDDVLGLGNYYVEVFGFLLGDDAVRLEKNAFGDYDSPLFIYKDGYQNVLKEYVSTPSITYEFTETFQWNYSTNYIYISKLYNVVDPQNPPAANMLLCSKVSFPNDIKLLTGDEDLESTDGTFTLQNVDSTIFNPDGAIDTIGVVNKYILDTDNFLNTFCQIPNQNLPLIDSDENRLELNELTMQPSHYPPSNWLRDYFYTQMPFQRRIVNWATINAHWMNNSEGIKAKLIELPCADAIKQRLDAKLGDEDFFGNEGLNFKINNDNDILISDAINKCETLIYTGEYEEGLVNFSSSTNPINFSEMAAWRQLNGLEGDIHEIYQEAVMVQTSGLGGACSNWTLQWFDRYYYYFDRDLWFLYGAEEGDYLITNTPWFDLYGYSRAHDIGMIECFSNTSGNDAGFTMQSSRKIYDNADGTHAPLLDAYYPGMNFTFFLDSNNNNTDITNIQVGQKTSTFGEVADNAIFINLFYDGTDTPYLFKQDAFNLGVDENEEEYSDECCSYEPFERVEWHFAWQTVTIVPTFKSYWNGTYPDSLNSGFSDGATCIENDIYWSPFSTGNFYMSGSTKRASHAGGSWVWFFPQEVASGQGKICHPTIGGTDVEFINYSKSNSDVKFKKGTMAPICHYDAYGNNIYYGRDKQWDYVVPENPEFTLISSRSLVQEGEKRQTVAFPMSDLSASDAIETSTYIFGKVSCTFSNIADEFSDDFETSFFKVRVSAARLSEEDDAVSFDLVDTELGTDIISLDASELSTACSNGDTVEYNSAHITGEGSNNTFDWGTGSANYLISDWISPDQLDALILSYRIDADDEAGFNKHISYRTNIHSLGVMQFTLFENALDSEFYIDTIGRCYTTYELIDEDGETKFRYNDELYTPSSAYKQKIENPADIIYHFIEKELGHVDKMNRDSWRKARDNNHSFKLGFSITDKIDSKNLIEDISKNTMLFPRFNYDGTFGFLNIKMIYSSQDAVEIDSDDVIKVNFSRTPTKDIHTIVNVKYKKDYAEDEYIKETGYCDGHDFFGNGEIVEGKYSYSYLGLSRNDNVLEFESDYIRDKSSALSLRNFIYLNNCNQHTKMKVRFPLKYSKYEVGDVIKFNKLINGIKSYGEDYSIQTTRNGQDIYPYFLIISTTKTAKYVDIELYQLHRLEKAFNIGMGSVSRASEFGVNGSNPIEHINYSDLSILSDFLNGDYQYFTTEQKRVANVSGTGVITDLDYLFLENILNGILNEDSDITLGDINGDGEVNVTDIAMLISYLLGGVYTDTPTEEQLELADFNDDGTIDVNDIVAMINSILEGE